MSTATTTTTTTRFDAFRQALPTAMSTSLGVLVGSFLLAAVYIAPEAGPRLWIAASTVYTALMVATMTIFAAHTPKLSKRWAVRFGSGLAITVVLFFVALFVSLQSLTTSPLVWVPVAIAVAIPVILGGRTRSAR